MRDANAHSEKKLTPRIDSRVSIALSDSTKMAGLTLCAIHTTIYNDGDLPGRKLEGQWKLTASDGIHETTNVIRADSLPADLPLELKHEISGNVSAIWSKPQVVLQVNIELNYLGFEDKPEHYQATYDYDFQHKEMILKK